MYEPPRVLGKDAFGTLAVCDGIVYYLTPCCQASAKGGWEGTICRACYEPLPDEYGWACLWQDFATELEPHTEGHPR